MAKFIYKEKLGITALKASFNKFSYKKHSHEEYTVGVTLRGTQKYSLDGSSQVSYKNGIMLFNPEQVHDGTAGNYKEGLDYVILYIKPKLFLEGLEKKELVKFSSAIIYNEKIKNDILNLSSAILHQKNEALCSELYLKFVDNFTLEKFFSKYKSEDIFIKKAAVVEFGFSDLSHLNRHFKRVYGITAYEYLKVKA